MYGCIAVWRCMALYWCIAIQWARDTETSLYCTIQQDVCCILLYCNTARSTASMQHTVHMYGPTRSASPSGQQPSGQHPQATKRCLRCGAISPGSEAAKATHAASVGCASPKATRRQCFQCWRDAMCRARPEKERPMWHSFSPRARPRALVELVCPAVGKGDQLGAVGGVAVGHPRAPCLDFSTHWWNDKPCYTALACCK